MTIRIAFIGAATLVLSASSAASQGRLAGGGSDLPARFKTLGEVS